MSRSAIHASNVNQVPKVPHWVIWKFGSVADGYDGSTPSITDYIAFLDEAEWKAEVVKLQLSSFESHRYLAGHVTMANISVNVDVKVSK